MHPPKVATAEVRAMIQSLAVGGRLPSGAAVRHALAERFGSRGGVARIYRLLAEEHVRLTLSPPAGSVEVLQSELRIVQEKLALSEAREEAHQSHWAQEVDRLRQKVLNLEPQINQARLIRESYELLRHQLQAAEQRAARFEEQLLVLQAAENEGNLLSGTESESLADVSSIK